MPVFTADYLKKLGAEIFERIGTSKSVAARVADSLVKSNLFGHDSHGVIRIPQYMSLIRSGHLNPSAKIEVEKETATTATLNGNWCFGQIVAQKAIELAIEKAKQHLMASVVAYQSCHVGRLGEYPTIAAEVGMIGLAAVNGHGGPAHMAPWGGIERRISTNPISFAAPTNKDYPVLIDMTSTVVAEGKVRVKRNRGEQLPEGWIIDAKGNPSTDPKDFYEPPRGSILPFGGLAGHKGYSLGIMVDILSGALSNAGCISKDAIGGKNGIFTMALNIESFVSVDEFKRTVSDYIDYIKSSPTAPGVDEILIPGEPEYRTFSKRLKAGLFVEDETWNQIIECANQLDVDL